MRRTESGCVDCGFPCMGTACPNYRVTVFQCDKCGAEDTLYETDEGEFCADCILLNLPKVEGSEL